MKKSFIPLKVRVSLVILLLFSQVSYTAVERESYYAHRARHDKFGVITPWNEGQNGPLDMRLRIAVEVMKRYPWVDKDKAVMAAPDFIYNSHWSIKEDGTILIPPTNDWMCGDLSQRAWSIIRGMTAYYAYSGDPMAFIYIPRISDYILDYAQTDDDADWPRFPIATPTMGKAYGKCNPGGRNQLDLCAIVGTEILRAYKLTGNERFFAAAKHWADVFADKCNLGPDLPPWNRYTNPEAVGWSDELTGSTTLILEFLDDILNMGYTGNNRKIIRARDAGVRYVNKLLENHWLENDTWARQYWDWDNPIMCGIVSMCGDYIMKNPDKFPNWKTDLRNILTLIFNRNGADQNSWGNMYSGAWAFPESATCCGTSLSYNQYTASPTLLRYSVLAEDDRIYEIGRRMIIMACYDSQANGVVKDGLLGNAVATGEWSNLAHPWPMCQVMEALAWTGQNLGPKRENHILRSTSVVNSVVYQKNKITYSTFDAPADTVDIIRLSFEPDKITAGTQKLDKRNDLFANGYLLHQLDDGDYILKIRHDFEKNIVITGTDDPQRQIDSDKLEFSKGWENITDKNAFGDNVKRSSEKGAYMKFSFKGNQFRLFGTVDKKGGTAEVYLDGQKQLTLIDCWNPEKRNCQLLYFINGLENKEHEIKVVVLDEGNLLSRGKNIYIDYVQYSNATAEPHFGHGAGPAATQRMIFGYPLRNDYIDSNGNPWRPATEWVIRSGYGKDTVKQAWWTDRRSMYIGNTDDEEIYRYGAYGSEFWANITVAPNRQYYAVLKFADTPLHPFLERDEKGQRVTHTVTVRINEKEVISKMNIAEKAGGIFRAYDRTFKNISPENGSIEVHLIGSERQGACIQALEIGPMQNLSEKR